MLKQPDCIVPGGGLTSAGKWVSSREKFFLPIKVLSRKFRGKFLYYLKQADLEYYGEQEYLQDPNCFNAFLSQLYQKEWIVYCKPPFKNASSVVEYLGRYTHRVAISNSRIVKSEDSQVSFKWRDYKDNNKWKVMTVSANEFIRRFLIHILPHRFMKIRHYGFLGNRNKSTKLIICKKFTNTPILPFVRASTNDLIQKIIGKDISRCPQCGSPKLGRCMSVGKSPPLFAQTA